MPDRKRIFITTSSFAECSSKPIDLLIENNIDFERNPTGRKLSQEELISYISDCDGVIAGTEVYNQEVFASLDKLRILSRLGVGVDNIDLVSAQIKNIKVTKCNTSPASSVAELTLSLFLNLSRRIVEMNNSLKEGIWKKKMGSLFSGKNLGIIGLGQIGKRIVEITQGMNLDYIAYDLVEDKEFAEKFNVKYDSLENLLAESNFISINLNSSESNLDLLDESKFRLMKQKPIIVNTSRGEVINEEALVSALENNTISGVGLDVFKEEPYPKSGKLLEFDNVICTPHVGAYSSEIREAMEIESVKNLIYGLKE
tara:strand:- start:272 stop:1210 length:939 start_codon:yes stop_codon:yes gene_type:complete